MKQRQHRKVRSSNNVYPQKFHKGDHVLIAKNLGSCMSHFTSGCEAIVMGSYEDKFGGRCYRDERPIAYALMIPNQGETAWYNENQLTLIKRNRQDLIKLWNDEIDANNAKKFDLDWIFNNGDLVLRKGLGASLSALAATLGFTQMWGLRGEGWDLAENQYRIMFLAKPYLEKNNKAGWLEFAEKMKPRVCVQDHRGLINFTVEEHMENETTPTN